MEPKQEYKTERKEPPNLRRAKCCATCAYHCEVWELCNVYKVTVDYYDLCDDYEPED